MSNHGGRQLDHTKACIDALPDVVEAVDGRVPVVVDGGFEGRTLLSALSGCNRGWHGAFRGIRNGCRWATRHWCKP